METEQTEGVVEKAVAYVKDMFGAPPYHRHVDSEGRPIMPTEDTGISPGENTYKSVAGVDAESARREEESSRGQ